ncbi:unnamed protein product, partial [Rotaria sp. Silwood1]
MTIELSKSKDREASQLNELVELRQSCTLLEREKLKLQVEIDSLRVKLSEEENAHKKIQEQLLVDKLKHVRTDEDLDHHSDEIIKDLEKKLNSERLALKTSNDELMQAQKKIRILEIDLKELTTKYNQLHSNYDLCKQTNEQSTEQIVFDNQRRIQYEKDIKQLQQELNNSLNKEKQMHDERDRLYHENERLIQELNRINNEYKINKTKLIDFEEQVEVESKFSVLYRTQMNELKDEINELTEKLRQINNEKKNIEEERDNLLKQIEITNVKLKTESLNLNLLQEQCAELEKEKNFMVIELDAIRKDFNSRLSLLDSEINT